MVDGFWLLSVAGVQIYIKFPVHPTPIHTADVSPPPLSCPGCVILKPVSTQCNATRGTKLTQVCIEAVSNAYAVATLGMALEQFEQFAMTCDDVIGVCLQWSEERWLADERHDVMACDVIAAGGPGAHSSCCSGWRRRWASSWTWVLISHCRLLFFDCLICGRSNSRVPTPPGKSWSFSLIFQDLEHHGKWVWSGKSLKKWKLWISFHQICSEVQIYFSWGSSHDPARGSGNTFQFLLLVFI